MYKCAWYGHLMAALHCYYLWYSFSPAPMQSCRSCYVLACSGRRALLQLLLLNRLHSEASAALLWQLLYYYPWPTSTKTVRARTNSDGSSRQYRKIQFNSCSGWSRVLVYQVSVRHIWKIRKFVFTYVRETFIKHLNSLLCAAFLGRPNRHVLWFPRA